MKVTIAKTAGFCMGVRRAVEMAFDAANSSSARICTYGPLIHNPQVLASLEERGISAIDEIPECGSGIVIIRAHGIPPGERNALKDAGFQVIDATCPRVIRVQSIISRHAKKGFSAIIVGDREHPEVTGLLGYAGDKGYVADSFDALEKLPAFDKAIIVAQTTQNTDFFEQVRKWAEQHHPHYQVFNTICDSTEKRQAEVKALSSAVDTVIVVGGFNSGNTRRLAEIAVGAGKPALHVETAEEIDIGKFSGVRHIGITAGASTPNWIIKQVYQDLESRLMLKNNPWRRWVFAWMRSLMMSNLYLALGAASLAVAGTLLQGLPVRAEYIIVAGLYILSMHTVNNMLERHSDRYNDPFRARFYQKNRTGLWLLAVMSGIGALFTASALGLLFLTLLVCMTVLGVLYNLDIVTRRGKRVRPRLKDIPGSKTILTALAWGIVIALFQPLHAIGRISAAGALVFFWGSALVFVRTAYFDIADMQGSRIMGRETIPILLGEKQTIRLLKGILIAMVIILFPAALAGIIPPGGIIMALCPAAMFFFLQKYEQGVLISAMRQGFLMESHLILAGILAVVGMWLF